MAITVSLEHWSIEVNKSQNEWNWKSPHLVQSSCSEQGNPEQIDRACAYLFLNTSKDTDSTTCICSFQCETTITRKKKIYKPIFFLMFGWNCLCFTLCPLSLALSLDTIKKSLASPIRYLYILIRFSWLHSSQKSPSFLVLSSCHRCSNSFIFSTVLHWTCSRKCISLFCWGPLALTQNIWRVSSGLSRGEESLP